MENKLEFISWWNVDVNLVITSQPPTSFCCSVILGRAREWQKGWNYITQLFVNGAFQRIVPTLDKWIWTKRLIVLRLFIAII